MHIMAKKRDKALRREFGTQETDKNLLQEKCARLKARIEELKNTMKEMLESVKKLQADLDEAYTSKLASENQAKTAKDQMTILQR